jgi:hypothetical protein
MDSIIFLLFFDRIYGIFRIFFPGFPEESLETPIAFGEKNYIKKFEHNR